MNLLKWPVWVRIAVILSIVWIGLMIEFADYFDFRSTNIRLSFNLELFLKDVSPVFLFWSLTWIIHGIWRGYKWKKSIKAGNKE